MADMRLPAPTWMVGCGNMGGAIIDGWRAADLDLSNLVVIRPSGKAIDGVRTVTGPAEAGAPPKLVVLAIKPQQLDEVAPLLRTYLSSQSIIVSVLAGVGLSSLRGRFPGASAIVRALPNLPVAIRRGVIALCSDDASDDVRRQVSEVFAPLGYAPWMADEARFAAVGSVAGAGPAYVARFIQALTNAGEKRGLSPEMSATIALETVFGTAWMAVAGGESMESVARRVASPNGTTEAGLAVLHREHVLDELIAVTVDAAARRGAELAEQAKPRSLA